MNKKELLQSFDSVSFSDDFEQDTIHKIQTMNSTTLMAQNNQSKRRHRMQQSSVGRHIALCAVLLLTLVLGVGSVAYATHSDWFTHLFGGQSHLVEEYVDITAYQQSSKHFNF